MDLEKRMLQAIIDDFKRSRRVVTDAFMNAFYVNDYELAATCKETIEKLDEAIAESTRIMGLLESR